VLDARTKRTFIKNSPVTTQTPSWILFSFDIERTKNSIDRSSFRGFIRSYVHHYYTSFLRTSRRTNYSSLIVLEILRLIGSRIRISSLLIESSFRGFSVYDLLRCDFATSDLTPRTGLDPHLYLHRHPESTDYPEVSRRSRRHLY